VRIGIVGSRRRNSKADRELVSAIVQDAPSGAVIVSGGCSKGADWFAELAAERHGHEMVVHYPEDVPRGSPRWAFTRANYARNKIVAEDVDVLYALVAEGRTGGTESTIRFAEKAGTPVEIR
jgi:hypothetical protein